MKDLLATLMAATFWILTYSTAERCFVFATELYGGGVKPHIFFAMIVCGVLSFIFALLGIVFTILTATLLERG